ncbi:hypothetical protein GDO81_007655 [Engystomops pustulosus]|uniref:Uncharacterized protein n=1 Tax=Engystomops pustulosus TaxID=76066 RepID=A0AAV7C9V1_ENGPU|nr:hypothetical protein GDO81_007655 [Engystomops pustulosus]
MAGMSINLCSSSQVFCSCSLQRAGIPKCGVTKLQPSRSYSVASSGYSGPSPVPWMSPTHR